MSVSSIVNQACAEALREAAQQALEALDWYAECAMVSEKAADAASALRAALEQPQPPQEAETLAEKVAYCAGWWDALEKMKGKAP